MVEDYLGQIKLVLTALQNIELPLPLRLLVDKTRRNAHTCFFGHGVG